MQNNKIESDIRNIQRASRDLVGHAVEFATNSGLPEREISRVTQQTVETGKYNQPSSSGGSGGGSGSDSWTGGGSSTEQLTR
jgi:hypothetical protein